ncbi:hypothetical protein DU478_19090 [Thalassococcus profundi]|uniref:Uncharacterized protein n=1 Tax=Thalassococcus profundi TaxID=2282382 RepID=A0A369TH43_9RHOB|nr:hypothetical protein [Thalassococcus profundi]RDD64669.1 hypothetical protein DU478_19090 [Thalassococcus profundi]
MATKDDIPTDLALEIGDDLEPRRFVAACREFFGLTDELAQVPREESVNWRVKVREGSNIVALSVGAQSDSNAVSAALQRMYEGATALVEGDFSAPVLTEKAIQHAKKLSDLTRSAGHITPMRFWLSRRPIDFGPEVGDLVRQDEASSYNDYGTLEGTLRAISDQAGGLEIRIQDPLWKRAIPCRVSDAQIEQAMEAFRRRVEVAGIIHYNRLGRPTSIRMESLTTLPEDKDLPTAADVKGLFAEHA